MSFKQNDYNGEDILIPSTVLGFKHWSFLSNSLKTSANVPKSSHHADWSSGEWSAVCGKLKDHKSPDVECTCGIYAHYLPLESYQVNTGVLGVVEASGKIVMGSKGFRAEKVKILALSGIGQTTKWFDFSTVFDACVPVLKKYCDPLGIEMFTDVQEMKEKFQPVDLSALGVDLVELESKILEEKSYEQTYKESVRGVAESNMKKHLEDYAKQQVASYGLDKAGSQRMMETLKHLGGF